MKKIYKDKIVNISGTDVFDNTFLFEYFDQPFNSPPRGRVGDIEVVFMRDLLVAKKNEDILQKVKQKPAMWSEVYSPKDELEIFTTLFEKALSEKKKIHIVGVTLGEEIKMLEEYYTQLGFLREDINAFEVDFSLPLVTVSCHIENLMWKGSDYKAQKDAIFFNPPVRESGQNKALFKGITRGVIAGIDFSHYQFSLIKGGVLEERAGLKKEYRNFLGNCIREEKILPLFMGKILKYNLEDIGFQGSMKELEVIY